MASTGMKVGALPDIKLKHLKKWIIDPYTKQHVYQIEVYSDSIKDKYITFCTPEAAKEVDEYLHLSIAVRYQYTDSTVFILDNPTHIAFCFYRYIENFIYMLHLKS
jgi:hypothetical protein